MVERPVCLVPVEAVGFPGCRIFRSDIDGITGTGTGVKVAPVFFPSIPLTGRGAGLDPLWRVLRVDFSGWPIGMFSLPRGSGGRMAAAEVVVTASDLFVFPPRRRRGSSSSCCTGSGAIERVARRDIGGVGGTGIGVGATNLRGSEPLVAASSRRLRFTAGIV